MIIGFIIWSLVAVIFIAIGISCRKSREAVGFFTGCKPPKIKDVKGYNHAVSVLWFVTGGIYELLGIPFLFLEQNSPWFILIVLAVVLGMIIMMGVYIKIESKYRKV